MKKAIILSVALLLAHGAEHSKADFTFGTLTNLVLTVNGSAQDIAPRILPGGLFLKVGSGRSDGFSKYDLWEVSTDPTVDLNGDGIVSFRDLFILSQYWLQEESSVDVAPPPLGDGIINLKDLAVFGSALA